MPDLNVRNVDESLMRAWKKAALEAEMTLRDWVIRGLEKETQRGTKAGMKDGGVGEITGVDEKKADGSIVDRGGFGSRDSSEGGADGSGEAVAAGDSPFTGADSRDYRSNVQNSATKAALGAIVPGAKCFCGSAVMWAKGADAGPMKWKCMHKGHYTTPTKAKE